VPGSHKLSTNLAYGARQPNRPEHEHDYNKLLIDGSFSDAMISAGLLPDEREYTPTRMVLNKGDIWLHDPRIFHRGTPNSKTIVAFSISVSPIHAMRPTALLPIAVHSRTNWNRLVCIAVPMVQTTTTLHPICC
jgi:ectoine hydroxylase-related dioxygenase (phytanoyl-CoA dioxygenase family)